MLFLTQELPTEHYDEELEIIDEEILCHECYNQRPNQKECESVEVKTEMIELGVDERNYVYCCECNHEIEFGYSHPEGGRIWPCESKDFNPWKTCPIGRYAQAWQKRGWIRPK